MDPDPLDESSQPGQNKRSKCNNFSSEIVSISQVALATASTALFAITAWFAASTFSGQPRDQANHILQSGLKLSFSSTVTVLRVLQGVTSVLTGEAVLQAFEGIQWTLASRHQGLRLLSLLSLSPSTGILGTVKLVFGRKELLADRAWAASRIFSAGLLFVAGLVLFVETSTMTAYESTQRFDVTAGTGQFHGSYVESFLEDNGHVVPYWALASTYNFVKNSVFSIPSHPISCPTRVTQCDSYLFPGGTYLMYPQPTSPLSTDSAIIIDSAPGTQVDFAQGLDPGDGFLAQDCIVYGSDSSSVGVEFCLAESRVSQGSILAGIFACSAGTQGGMCRLSPSQQQGHVPNVSATMTVYSRSASSVCAASNNSILSVYHLGDAQLDLTVNISALHLAAGWLLNYTASGLPAESSLSFWFWFAQSDTYNAIWESSAYTTLQSMLSFILWEFCTNNNENPAVAPEESGGQPDLPAAFRTTASVSRPFTRLVLLRATFVTYVVLEACALVFCWAVIVWRSFSQRHALEISSYPLVDFTSKLGEKSTVDGSTDTDTGRSTGTGTGSIPQLMTLESGDKAVRHFLADVKMVVVRQHSDVITPDHGSVSSSSLDRGDLAGGARSSHSEQPRLVNNEDTHAQEKSPVEQTEPQVDHWTDLRSPPSPTASHARRLSGGNDKDAANITVELADGANPAHRE